MISANDLTQYKSDFTVVHISGGPNFDQGCVTSVGPVLDPQIYKLFQMYKNQPQLYKSLSNI